MRRPMGRRGKLVGARGHAFRSTLLTACLLGLISVGAGAAATQEPQLPSLAERAQKAVVEGRWEEAQQVYEEIVNINPRSPEAFSNLGYVLYRLENYSSAIARLQKALALNPNLSHTRALLGLCYFYTNQFSRAIPILETSVKQEKDNPELVQHLGLAYLKVGENEKAIAMFSRWVELEPRNPDALYYKGQASLSLALTTFEKLKEVAPNSYRMHQLQAELLHEQGQVEPAIAEYKLAIAEEPQMAGLRYALGSLYWENRRLDEAKNELEEELKLTSNDPGVHFLLGDIYLQQQQLALAQEHLARALEIKPELVEAQVDLAKLYRFQGHSDLAVEKFQQIARVDPDRSDVHYMLFELYRDSGQMEQARKEQEIFQTLKRKEAERRTPNTLQRDVDQRVSRER